MRNNYLKKVALLTLNIPSSLGLLIILERRMEFGTPGYWIATRFFDARLRKPFVPWAWMGVSIDFVLCFAVVRVGYLLFLTLINHVERWPGIGSVLRCDGFFDDTNCRSHKRQPSCHGIQSCLHKVARARILPPLVVVVRKQS